MPTYGKRETPFKKQWRPFVFDFDHPVLLKVRLRPKGVSRGGMRAINRGR